jgi:hypothetical protein
MELTINKHLEIIEKAIEWVTNSLQGEKQRIAKRNFVNIRRKLNKKKFALESNPAAALFGESQVGKSYLVGSLLSESAKPFSLIDQDGIPYNFIEKINPPGGGSESTSLVTRFSTQYQPINLQYPIKVKLLTPADIVLVLCDSFYNDVKLTYDVVKQSININEKIQSLIQNYTFPLNVVQTVFKEDDVLDIKDYITDNFQQKAGEVLHSTFFDDIPRLISQIKPNEWKNVFSLLWNQNSEFTKLFENLISEYEKLDFTDTLYLPLEAVFYKYGTLLDVERLKEIYNLPQKIEPNYKAETALIYHINGQEKEIKSFPKNYLCALSAELIFSQPKTLVDTKKFLATTDLLDFPGSRARKTTPENMINEKAMPDLLKRGKVAYLFNKYSNSEKINILLFCAKHELAGERTMPEMLNNWINKIVGDNPQTREKFINKSKIPPLFIVETWFNVNLQYNPLLDTKDDNSSLNYRWNQRFDRTLAEEKIDNKIYNWFNNWTTKQPNFQNIFLLRDFEKSDEYGSKLFKGFRKSKKELEEIKPPEYPDFRKNLRQSFLEFEFVKRHFENPQVSWDSAASINKDGSELIIEKLTIAANNINSARIEKTQRELNKISNEVIEEQRKYFHDDDSDAALKKAKSTAGEIRAKLDIAFSKDPYFFGKLMKELILNEGSVYNFYLKNINDIEKRDVINKDKYIAFRINVPELSPQNSFEENVQILCRQYNMDVNRCEDYFNEEGIDLNELFYGNIERVKNFSQVLADKLEIYWFDEHLQSKIQNLKELLPETQLQDLRDMLRSLFRKLEISKIIDENIRRYVDGARNIEEAYEMIADISTEIINKFINSVGMEYLTKSDSDDLKKANEDKNVNLELILDHSALQFAKNDREEAAELISKTANLPKLLNKDPIPKDSIKLLPNYRNYIIWYDLLKVGFISVCNIPNYDVHANSVLKEIIGQSSNIKY